MNKLNQYVLKYLTDVVKMPTVQKEREKAIIAWQNAKEVNIGAELGFLVESTLIVKTFEVVKYDLEKGTTPDDIAVNLITQLANRPRGFGQVIEHVYLGNAYDTVITDFVKLIKAAQKNFDPLETNDTYKPTKVPRVGTFKETTH